MRRILERLSVHVDFFLNHLNRVASLGNTALNVIQFRISGVLEHHHIMRPGTSDGGQPGPGNLDSRQRDGIRCTNAIFKFIHQQKITHQKRIFH